MQGRKHICIAYRCWNKDGVAVAEKGAARGFIAGRAIKNDVFLIIAVGEVRPHMIDQIAVVGRTGIEEKIFILQDAESRVFKAAQRVAAGFLNVQINQLHPRMWVQSRNAQARHERQGAFAHPTLGVGKDHRTRFRQRWLIGELRAVRVQDRCSGVAVRLLLSATNHRLIAFLGNGSGERF